MGIYRRHGSPYWYYSFTVHGRRISGSTKALNKTLARQIAEAKKIDLLRDQVNLKVKRRMPLQELASEFLDWSKAHKRSYKRDVVLAGHLTTFMGSKDIVDISSLDVEEYKKKRVKEVKGSTVNREVACLKRMFNLAIKWGYLDSNSVKGVAFFKEPRKNFRWFPEEEIEKFLEVSSSRMKAIFLVGINTGLRISELLSLKWPQVDFINGYITVEESKTDEYRKVKMNPVVISVLETLERKSPHVFANAEGKPFYRINKAFKNTCKRAGIAPASPHAMRHTFASHLMKLGVDPYTVMELGGWKSLDMVMRYTHLAPDHRQMAVNKLAGIECLKNAAKSLQCSNGEPESGQRKLIKINSAPIAQ